MYFPEIFPSKARREEDQTSDASNGAAGRLVSVASYIMALGAVHQRSLAWATYVTLFALSAQNIKLSHNEFIRDRLVARRKLTVSDSKKMHSSELLMPKYVD